MNRLPLLCGIGLRAPHYRRVLETLPRVGWLEGHSENYFGEGGRHRHYLERLRHHYPVSLHGVGLSLGSTDPMDQSHLMTLRALVEWVQPFRVSEHLCWSSIQGCHLNHLLPLPYTEEALDHVSRRVTFSQEFLGRRILLENVSTYLELSASRMPEWEFLTEVSRRSGCGILLDVNNVYVSARNHGWDPVRYLDHLVGEAVLEIHLAGFESHGGLLVDTHSRPVSDSVWNLYELALKRLGPVPTLVEWDADLPPLQSLLDEAGRATRLMETCHADVAANPVAFS